MNRLFGAGAFLRQGLSGGSWEGETGWDHPPIGPVADYGKRLTLVKCEPFVSSGNDFPQGGVGGELVGVILSAGPWRIFGLSFSHFVFIVFSVWCLVTF